MVIYIRSGLVCNVLCTVLERKCPKERYRLMNGLMVVTVKLIGRIDNRNAMWLDLYVVTVVS